MNKGLLDIPNRNLTGFSGVSLVRNSNQSVANNTATAISWESKLVDTDGYWSRGDPTKIKLQGAGVYMILANNVWSPSGVGIREIRLTRSIELITQYIAAFRHAPAAAITIGVSLETLQFLDCEYVQITVSQNSGGSLNMISTTNTPPASVTLWKVA